MNKTTFSTLIIIVILLGGYFLFNNSNQKTLLQSPTSGSQAIEQTSKQVTPKTESSSVIVSTTYNVSIKDFSFSQKSINIKKGDTVVWVNKDITPHTVTGVNGGPASGTLNKDDMYSFTFNNIGTFDYYCTFHLSMKGSVVVIQ